MSKTANIKIGTSLLNADLLNGYNWDNCVLNGKNIKPQSISLDRIADDLNKSLVATSIFYGNNSTKTKFDELLKCGIYRFNEFDEKINGYTYQHGHIFVLNGANYDVNVTQIIFSRQDTVTPPSMRVGSRNSETGVITWKDWNTLAYIELPKELTKEDLNTVTSNKLTSYYAEWSNSCKNKPSGVTDSNFGLLVFPIATVNICQIMVANSGTIYRRIGYDRGDGKNLDFSDWVNLTPTQYTIEVDFTNAEEESNGVYSGIIKIYRNNIIIANNDITTETIKNLYNSLTQLKIKTHVGIEIITTPDLFKVSDETIGLSKISLLSAWDIYLTGIISVNIEETRIQYKMLNSRIIE